MNNTALTVLDDFDTVVRRQERLARELKQAAPTPAPEVTSALVPTPEHPPVERKAIFRGRNGPIIYMDELAWVPSVGSPHFRSGKSFIAQHFINQLLEKHHDLRVVTVTLDTEGITERMERAMERYMRSTRIRIEEIDHVRKS